MSKMTLTDLAKAGYEAYGEEAEWKAYNGSPMPTWDELRPDIHRKWKVATAAVVSHVQAGEVDLIDVNPNTGSIKVDLLDADGNA